MKINEVLTEDQIDELGIAKGIGKLARGIGAVAGGVHGALDAGAQGYRAGRAAVSGQQITHSNGRSIKQGEHFDAVTGQPLPQQSTNTPAANAPSTAQSTNPLSAPTVPQNTAGTTSYTPQKSGIAQGGTLYSPGVASTQKPAATPAQTKTSNPLTAPVIPQKANGVSTSAAPKAAAVSPAEQQWEANLKKQGMTQDEIEKARPAYRARQNKPLPQAGGTTLAANRPAAKPGDYDWAGGGVGPNTKLGDISKMQKPTSESNVFYSRFLGRDI